MYPHTHNNHRPRIVALEGLDGAGKTQTAKRLCEPLGAHYRDDARPVGAVHLLDQHVRPFEIRASVGDDLDPVALELMMAGIRRQGWARIQGHGAGASDVVVIDRWVASAVAYHDGEESAAWLCALHTTVPTPDVTLLLDIEPDVAMMRKPRDVDWEVLARARERYHKLVADAHPVLGRCYVIDAHQTMDGVFEDCVAVLRKEQIL